MHAMQRPNFSKCLSFIGSGVSMNTSATFDRGWVMVMWDVEDLSILNRLDPELVKKNIMSDLDDQGFFSGLSNIWAVVDDNIPKTLRDIYESAGISTTLVPQGNKHARVHSMSVSSLTWALREQNNRSTLIILSENMKEDKQFTSVVEAFKKKGNYNIVIQDPRSLLDKCVGVPVHKTNKRVDVDKSNNCVDEIPVDKSKHGYRGQRRRRLSSGLSSGVSKFVNSSAENMFSSISQSRFAWKDTDIFWDFKDSSSLYEHDPVLIYRSIKSALWEKGYQGHWQIRAFFVGDENALSKDLIDKYIGNRIWPIPLPKECAIVQVMILRILDWARRTCGRPSNLIILSSNIKEENQVASVVQALRKKGNYNIVFQDPASLLHQCLGNPFHQSGREPTENATL